MRDARPPYRSHLVPRSTEGRAAVGVFLLLLALAEPPFVHAVANRVEPWVLGLPFLYTWLLLVYTGMILVLLWALWRGV